MVKMIYFIGIMLIATGLSFVADSKTVIDGEARYYIKDFKKGTLFVAIGLSVLIINFILSN